MTSKRIQYDKMRIKRSFLRLNFEMTSRIMFLLSFLALVVMNMRSYSSSPKYIVGLEEKDEANRRNSDNRRSFIKVTLATILQKTFSENLQLFNLYNGDDAIIFDLNTPQGKAFDWILSFDEYQHSKTNSEHFDPSDNPTIIQRYILAVLFFATGGEYNRNLGSEFSPQHNKQGSWTSDGMLGFLSKKSHECSWKGEDALKNVKGVTKCDIHTKEVTELILPELSLHGELPEEIGYLSNLVTLDFQNNVLVGSVPQSIGRLTSLRTLGMSQSRGQIRINFSRRHDYFSNMKSF